MINFCVLSSGWFFTELTELSLTLALALFFTLDNNLEVLPGNCAEHVFTIEIDIPIGPGQQHLNERFEWDLSNPDNSTEEFAACLVSDYLYEQS